MSSREPIALSSHDFFTVNTHSFALIILVVIVVIIILLLIYLAILLLSMYVKPCSAAPSAPTNVQAGFVDTNNFSVFWNAVTGANSYTVYVGQTQTFTSSQSIKVITTNTTQATVSGLIAGRTYYIYVTATNACGTSTASSEIQFTFV